jgi:hypothetical protein
LIGAYPDNKAPMQTGAGQANHLVGLGQGSFGNQQKATA